MDLFIISEHESYGKAYKFRNVYIDMFAGVRTRGQWRSEKTSLTTRGDCCRKNEKTGNAA